MSDPLERVVLRAGGSGGGEAVSLHQACVSATALAKCHGDVDLFLVGSEDGLVHCGSRKGVSASADGNVARGGGGGRGERGAKLGQQVSVHSAPVTSLTMHPPGDAAKPSLTHIAASAAMDITCPISIWDSKTGRSVTRPLQRRFAALPSPSPSPLASPPRHVSVTLLLYIPPLLPVDGRWNSRRSHH